MEWIEEENGHWYPTQLAATKVDADWNQADVFAAFIRPRNIEDQDWTHVAYTGGTASDFLNAESALKVLSDFMAWLNDDDIILWWYEESLSLFKMMLDIAIKDSHKPNMLYLSKFLVTFFISNGLRKQTPYYAANAIGVDTRPTLKHYAPNDVRVICELLSKLQYPHKDVLNPPAEFSFPSLQTNPDYNPFLPYQLHIPTKIVHAKGCNELSLYDTSTKGIGFLKTAIRKGYEPCSCCRDEFKSTQKELKRSRNLSTLKNSQYSYFYASGSNVFHNASCHLVLSANKLMGACKYKTIIKKGKVPCKRCNPGPDDEIPVASTRIAPNIEKSKTTAPQHLSKEEIRALKRQQTANDERSRRLSDDTLSDTEKSDIYTLTQPGYAFWAAQGYRTFHLRSCSKLQNLTSLKGFSTYQEAISCGHSPCKTCKPTPKHDALFSVPITSRTRKDETVGDIMSKCASLRYDIVSKEKGVFIVTTPVGKWRIYKKGAAIKLDHINYVHSPGATDYHEQPRLMLSYGDAIDYIHRHDSNLATRHTKGNK